MFNSLAETGVLTGTCVRGRQNNVAGEFWNSNFAHKLRNKNRQLHKVGEKMSQIMLRDLF